MDNLDTIKYKEAESEGWFYKIDIASGSKQSFNSKKRIGLNNEMQVWVKAGNKIEPQYTADELTQKETDDFNNAIESQKSTCIQLLDASEKAVSKDPPYPDDIEIWKEARNQWREIIKSDKIEEIPDKPF